MVLNALIAEQAVNSERAEDLDGERGTGKGSAVEDDAKAG